MHHLWPLIQQAAAKPLQAIQEPYQTQFQKLAEAENTTTEHIAHFIYTIENFNYKELTIEDYRLRTPYDHPDAVQAQFDLCARNGWLESSVYGRYRVTDKGHQLRQARWEIANPLLDTVDLLPVADVQRLLDLLTKVTDAIDAAPEPPAKYAFNTRRNTGLPCFAGSCPWWHIVFGRRMDLLAYRDDIHLAVWQRNYPVTAHTWEVFTHLWAGEGNCLYDMTKNLGHRGYQKDDTEASLRNLLAHGWSEEMPDNLGHFQVTVKGRAAREDAEEQTDKYFYAPFSTLTTSELEDLEQLLKAL